MEKIFIRERINVVDYDNNNMALLFTSGEMEVEGGIGNIGLESDVSGWHQLTFTAPAKIVSEGGVVDNPLLDNLYPLSKIKYTRTVSEGDKLSETVLYFIVQPQTNKRDDNGLITYAYTCIDYPRHILSKSKNGLTIGNETIDEERSMTPGNELMNVEGMFYYIKAPVQTWTVGNYEELALWSDALPGAFARDTSTNTCYRLVGTEAGARDVNGNLSNWYELGENETYTIDPDTKAYIPDAVWSPDWNGYPWTPDLSEYEYGDVDLDYVYAGIYNFYWDTYWTNPQRKIGRYEGTLYQEDSRLIYNVYETTEYAFPTTHLGTYIQIDNVDTSTISFLVGTTVYILETGTVWEWIETTPGNYGWQDTHETKSEVFKNENILAGKWNKMDPIKAYLSPNNAENYLDHILEGTGWKVGTVDTIMIENGTVEFIESGTVSPAEIELTTSVSISNSNTYNAIGEVCNAFKCYARYDHENRTVSLKATPSDEDNDDLFFNYRENLKNAQVVQDGEKAVSKLWVYGGEDLVGEVAIQDCNRMNPNYYLATYLSMDDLITRVSNPIEGNYAKIETTLQWDELTNVIATVATLDDKPSSANALDLIFITNQNSYWIWHPTENEWYDTFSEALVSKEDEELVLEARYDYENGQWVYKGQFYHWYEPVSPIADNYIMDFSYFLDRGLISEEQVDDIKYNYILPISRLNTKRWPLYNQYSSLNLDLLTYNNTYDECKIARDAIDAMLRTTYAIYELDTEIDTWHIKELNVTAYPPGAHIDTTGWVKAEIPYSTSQNIPEAPTYADIATVYPSPTIGDYIKVTDEVAVYYYSNTYSFSDTISAYLGETELSFRNDPELRKTELLTNVAGNIEARVRGEGLFQKLRDEELFGDESRASIAPWYNPPANQNDLPAGGAEDATGTSTAYTYYNAQDRYVTEQINMNTALDRIGETEIAMTTVLAKIEVLEEQINELQYKLREVYGDFIVEGVFSDSTMVWPYNLWYAGLEALELYHRPLITYSLTAMDVSGLPEYATMTNDVYHDIVYRLNRSDLVLPEAGAYCYITDESLGIIREKGHVTSIKRNISNPSQHALTIATVDTNTEDLIGKLVTAANTIYNKEHIYNRSSVINSDGTIASDSLGESLEDTSGELNLLSNNGTVVFGENGITTTDRNDPNLRMKYTGKGIFASEDGGALWSNIISAGEVNVRSLSAGTIDSNLISVTNIGHNSSIIVDGKGITAMNYDTASISPSFDIPNMKNVSFFLDATSGHAYFKGMVQAGSGLIGGWSIGTDKLSSMSGSNFTAMSSSGTYAFWAGAEDPAEAPFSVTHTGVVKGSSGTIGGFTIGTNTLTGDRVGLGSSSNTWAFWSGSNTDSSAPFRVDHDGNLYATTGEIAGWTISSTGISKGGTTLAGTTGNITTSKLYASGGTVGGWYITGSEIRSASGKAVLGASGYIKITNNDNDEYFFGAGYGTNHPVCSGLTSGSEGFHIHPKLNGVNSTGTTAAGGMYYNADGEDKLMIYSTGSYGLMIANGQSAATANSYVKMDNDDNMVISTGELNLNGDIWVNVGA